MVVATQLCGIDSQNLPTKRLLPIIECKHNRHNCNFKRAIVCMLVYELLKLLAAQHHVQMLQLILLNIFLEIHDFREIFPLEQISNHLPKWSWFCTRRLIAMPHFEHDFEQIG